MCLTRWNIIFQIKINKTCRREISIPRISTGYKLLNTPNTSINVVYKYWHNPQCGNLHKDGNRYAIKQSRSSNQHIVISYVIYYGIYIYDNLHILIISLKHGDVTKWRHFPLYWPFERGIYRSPVNSPYRGQWRGALIFSLICAWTNSWVNDRDAGDWRRHRAHYDITVTNKDCSCDIRCLRSE